MTPVVTTDHIANSIGATVVAAAAAILWRITRRKPR